MDQVIEGCVCRVFLLNGDLLEVVLNKKHTVKDILVLSNRQCEVPFASWTLFELAYIDEKWVLVYIDWQFSQRGPTFPVNSTPISQEPIKPSKFRQQVVWLSPEERITQIPFPKCVAAWSEVKLHQFVRFFPRNLATVTDAITLLHLFYDARLQFLKVSSSYVLLINMNLQGLSQSRSYRFHILLYFSHNSLERPIESRVRSFVVLFFLSSRNLASTRSLMFLTSK